MDSSNPLCFTTTLSNDENEKKVSTMVQSKRARFFKTYQRQSFSFPDSLMLYIAKNPLTPELYEKMIETCKYFFIRNPILVVDQWVYDGGDKCNNAAFNENITSFITPKIFRCDIKWLTLHDQIISFDDLSILISTAESINLTNVAVKNNDGSIVEIEKIVEVSVKAKDIDISDPPITMISSKTMKELVKIPCFSKLDYFYFNRISEAFDIEAFYVYMKKNRHTFFFLHFDDSVSDVYKNRLEEIFDEIFATEVFNYKPPVILFPGISHEKKVMLMTYTDNFRKIAC